MAVTFTFIIKSKGNLLPEQLYLYYTCDPSNPPPLRYIQTVSTSRHNVVVQCRIFTSIYVFCVIYEAVIVYN